MVPIMYCCPSYQVAVAVAKEMIVEETFSMNSTEMRERNALFQMTEKLYAVRLRVELIVLELQVVTQFVVQEAAQTRSCSTCILYG